MALNYEVKAQSQLGPNIVLYHIILILHNTMIWHDILSYPIPCDFMPYHTIQHGMIYFYILD